MTDNRRSPRLFLLLLSFFCFAWASPVAAQNKKNSQKTPALNKPAPTPKPLSTNKVKVSGSVYENEKNETVPFANIVVLGTTMGTTTDENGNFEFDFPAGADIQVTAVGFSAKVITLGDNSPQILKVVLENVNTQLKTVVINSGKYKNKGNPAVELMRRVIANKKNNRLEANDYYQYQKYEKIELDLVNVGEDIKNSKWTKNFKFVFDKEDSVRLKGKKLLPAYLRETLGEVYYRKSTDTKKEFQLGERQSELEGLLDGDGVGNYLEKLYANVDIYDNSILLVNKQFLSPLSPLAPDFYRFYIMDTSAVEGIRCIHLAFFSRSKTDLLFVGDLYVTDDERVAVRKIKLGLPEDVNINFLNSLVVEQSFDQLPNGLPTLVRDVVTIDFALTGKQKSFGFYGRKSTSLKDFKLNEPRNPADYMGDKIVIKHPLADKRPSEFWGGTRHDTLNTTEAGIYQTIDSVKNVPDYKRFTHLTNLLFSGFWDFGKLEIGPWSSLYSFNPIEGNRFRIGGRTTKDFSNRVRLEGFAMYATKDKRWKYGGAITYKFNDSNFGERPQSALRLQFNNDTELPGQELQGVYEDNFFLSFRRGEYNKLYYRRQINFSYVNEAENGLTYRIGALRNAHHPSDSSILRFEHQDADGREINSPNLYTTEGYLHLRYAPNEEFYQGKNRRRPIINQHPVYTLNINAGQAAPSGSPIRYNYQRIQADFFKRFFVTPFGHSDIQAEAGYINGQVPYPLLFNHRANQTLANQLNSYNLMNYLEFVSDKYVSLNYTHYFGGFFFNKIPLLKKLQLREIITFKAIYGSVRPENDPNLNKNLFGLPRDADGQLETFTLEKMPYMEMNFGVSNIFKFFRVDVLRRLNYLDNPYVSKWGVRARLRFDF
jgi:Family of unknown function (DUF5686)/CarboxypepD_reg-like domain